MRQRQRQRDRPRDRDRDRPRDRESESETEPNRQTDKKSNRQIRLAKQQHYSNVNNLFVTGNPFTLSGQTEQYTYSNTSSSTYGIIKSVVTGYVCNVDYIGRTKVTGFTFVLGKQVKIELNLKTLQFVS